MVGSDEAAQSDIYSAVTFAGVIGTTCIVLAGAHAEPMPAAQRARLDAADPGGWIVGGLAAVPAAKTAGRDMVRLAGQDRWHTARLVGAVAADPDGDIAELTARTAPSAPGPAAIANTAVAAGSSHSCAIRSDGTLACWGTNHRGQLSAPSGTYTAAGAGRWHSCAIRSDRPWPAGEATSLWSPMRRQAGSDCRSGFRARCM